MKILLYTHSDYSWVWKYWHQQTDKFINSFDKVCMINSNSDFRSDYDILKYDDNESYKRRILSCINQLNDEEIILFTHEDMFLYSKPNIEVISRLYKLNK